MEDRGAWKKAEALEAHKAEIAVTISMMRLSSLTLFTCTVGGLGWK
jgi:hypothetical protein